MTKPTPGNADPLYSIVVITSVRKSLYDLLRSLQEVDRMNRAEVIIVYQEKDGTLDLPLIGSMPDPVTSRYRPLACGSGETRA